MNWHVGRCEDPGSWSSYYKPNSPAAAVTAIATPMILTLEYLQCLETVSFDMNVTVECHIVCKE